MTPEQLLDAITQRMRAKLADRNKYRGSRGLTRAMAEANAEVRGGRGGISHEAIVAAAIRDGEPVPKEVLDAFPRLKQPWELTQAEYDERFNSSRTHRRDPAAEDRHPVSGRTWGQDARRHDVRRAVCGGLPVPPHVLGDFAELAAEPAADPEAG